MTLQVIGPGFGRTGTASLKRALELLGLAPCHHMEEVPNHPEQVPHWVDFSLGRPVDWGTLFAGYRAQVDWPGANAWRQLAAQFPNAKVILSVRDEEAWWKSFSGTIGTSLRQPREPGLPPHRHAMRDANERIIIEQTFDGRVEDRDHCIAALRRRIAEVKAEIAPKRLLVYDVREGWGPLCGFLGIPVPDGPFPAVNSTEQFWARKAGTPLPAR